MSRHGSMEHAPGELSELQIIREETSPTSSTVNAKPKHLFQGTPYYCCKACKCAEYKEPSMELKEVEKLLNEKEKDLRVEFGERLNNEIILLKERADFILQNEQIRASYMLREAHRERQEKISALQTQLECKNLAGLMYVMCTERKKSKIEKMAIIEEYTNYIIALQEILTEAQSLILNLSRGYKTAARVDKEWRQKMKKTVMEFQMFVHDFMKGTPESDQYFFDLPKLLEIKSPIVDNPVEDPCNCEDDESVEEETKSLEGEKPWYERVDAVCRPFIMFGDMAEFKPPQRRQVLNARKNVKTAPRRWKEYVFHDMFVNAECSNADAIKDEYPNRVPPPPVWDCTGQSLISPEELPARPSSVGGPGWRRGTAPSIDFRGGMGSILKIITTSTPQAPVQAKANVLGARDSMEIASTTKLREKHKHSETSKVIINVGSRRTSLFDDKFNDDDVDKKFTQPEASSTKDKEEDKTEGDKAEEEDSATALRSGHNDSLTAVSTRRPDRDHKIHYEKVCPVEECQRGHVDSFLLSLPAYMRASPFTYFEQTFDEYEACSPGQLEVLRERIEKKKNKEKFDADIPDLNPLEEWSRREVEGTAVQTSELSFSLPECTCRGPNPSVASSQGQIFKLEDLFPLKQVLSQINRQCFFDNNIEFDRFKVIGEGSNATIKNQRARDNKKNDRLYEVKKVLKQHPSLLDIFQANAA